MHNDHFSELEVRAAIFQKALSKVPGPDGFSAVCFQKCWNSIRDELTSKIYVMLNESIIDEGINDNIFALVPKTKIRTPLEEFRPISLCYVIGKVITKVLANRIKAVLQEIISYNQSAFVSGRMIPDNFLLAHELSHFINTRNKQKVGFSP